MREAIVHYHIEGIPAAVATELKRLRRIEELALIWSAYQDDDSKADQATDVHLRTQADEAALVLYEAVNDGRSASFAALRDASSGCDHCGDHPDGLGDGAPCPSCGKGPASNSPAAR